MRKETLKKTTTQNRAVSNATKYLTLTTILLLVVAAPTLATLKTEAQEAGYHETLYADEITPANTTDQLRLRTNGLTRFFIQNNGDVGVGTQTPQARFSIDNQNYLVDGLEIRSFGDLGAALKISGTSRVGEFNLYNQEIPRVRITAGYNADSYLATHGSNSRLGIGTDSPTEKLHVQGNILATGGITASSANFSEVCIGGNCETSWPAGGGSGLWSEDEGDIYYNSGDVGIGVTNPTHPLHISGSTLIQGTSNVLQFQSTDNNWLYTEYHNSTGDRQAWVGLDGGLNNYRIAVEGNTQNIILQGGNVGIGTNTPSRQLDVDGTTILNGLTTIRGSQGILQLQGTDSSFVRSEYLDMNGDLLATTGMNYVLDDFQITVEDPGYDITLTGGNVGIGRSNPQEQLHVDGTVLVEEDARIQRNVDVQENITAGGVMKGDVVVSEANIGHGCTHNGCVRCDTYTISGSEVTCQRPRVLYTNPANGDRIDGYLTSGGNAVHWACRAIGALDFVDTPRITVGSPRVSFQQGGSYYLGGRWFEASSGDTAWELVCSLS